LFLSSFNLKKFNAQQNQQQEGRYAVAGGRQILFVDAFDIVHRQVFQLVDVGNRLF